MTLHCRPSTPALAERSPAAIGEGGALEPREDQMPGATLPSEPSIPRAPVTAAILDSLREIVGDKGLILDDRDKQPFVTDWHGLRIGQAGAVVRPVHTGEG